MDKQFSVFDLRLQNTDRLTKSLAMTGCEFCLAAPLRHMTRPHQDQDERLGLEGPEGVERGRDGLPREVLPYEPS